MSAELPPKLEKKRQWLRNVQQELESRDAEPFDWTSLNEDELAKARTEVVSELTNLNHVNKARTEYFNPRKNPDSPMNLEYDAQIEYRGVQCHLLLTG